MVGRFVVCAESMSHGLAAGFLINHFLFGIRLGFL